MRRLTLLLPALLGLALAPAAARAQDAGDPLAAAAAHITILDYATNRILYCSACDEPMPPASMSKLMTILIVAEKLKAGSIKPGTMLPVSENAWRHGAMSDGSHMFLDINSQVSVDNLLHGVSIVSANDACIVLAEGIAGSEEGFVDLMNKRASQLGLKSAHFRNATGLDDPGHQISSADLARLSRYIIANFPDVYRFDSQPSFTYNGKTQENRNPLLAGAFAFRGADGVKTGHTDSSGYGMVGSATLNGKRRVIVFNGAKSMKDRGMVADLIMRSAFYDFDARTLFKKGAKVGEANVWLGGRKTVPLVATQSIDVGYRRAAKDQIKVAIVYDAPVPAPIRKGDVIARLVISGPGVEPQTIPLAAGDGVGRENMFSRALFGAKALFAKK
jgi:D-alanyl-D-alanine carboxypeptidase (penicillin-binding protein 5/6)